MTDELTENNAVLNRNKYMIDSIWIGDDYVTLLDSLDGSTLGLGIHHKDAQLTTNLKMTAKQTRGLIECLESRLKHLD